MKHILLPLTALLTATLYVACGGDDEGSEPSNGGGTSCSAVTACGGTVTGSWKIAGFCPDTTKVPDRVKAICDSATIDYDKPTVSGTIEFKADGTYSQTANASGTGYVVLGASCLNDAVKTCDDVEELINANSNIDTKFDCASSGGGCRCALPITDAANGNGTYTASGNSLKLVSGTATQDSTYCVKDDKLHLNVSLSADGASDELYGQLELTK